MLLLSVFNSFTASVLIKVSDHHQHVIIFRKCSWPPEYFVLWISEQRTEPLLLNKTKCFILASCTFFYQHLNVGEFHKKSNILNKTDYCHRRSLDQIQNGDWVLIYMLNDDCIIWHIYICDFLFLLLLFWSIYSVLFQKICNSTSYLITVKTWKSRKCHQWRGKSSN